MTAMRSATWAATPRSWVISMIAMPVSRCSSRSRSRICAWVVTSRAVVGSSAMSRSGPQDSAMAIMARCSMPPLIWNGYSSTRRSGAAIPTRRSSSTTRVRASALVASPCRISASPIWLPRVCMGLMEAMGSWNTMATFRPRTARSSGPGASTMSTTPSSPCTRMCPPVIRPGLSIRRSTERAMTLLPHPDSPTTARTSPRPMVRSTPSTARTIPSSSSNPVCRSSISSSVSGCFIASPYVYGLLVRVGGVAQSVADEVHGEHGDEHRDAGEQQPWSALHGADVLRLLQQHTPADGG